MHTFNTKSAQRLIANQVNRTLRNMRECPIKRVEVRQDIYVEDLAQLANILFGILATIESTVSVSLACSREHAEFVETMERTRGLMEASNNLRAAINSGRVTI